jgi:hypothetical protein
MPENKKPRRRRRSPQPDTQRNDARASGFNVDDANPTSDPNSETQTTNVTSPATNAETCPSISPEDLLGLQCLIASLEGPGSKPECFGSSPEASLLGLLAHRDLSRAGFAWGAEQALGSDWRSLGRTVVEENAPWLLNRFNWYVEGRAEPMSQETEIASKPNISPEPTSRAKLCRPSPEMIRLVVRLCEMGFSPAARWLREEPFDPAALDDESFKSILPWIGEVDYGLLLRCVDSEMSMYREAEHERNGRDDHNGECGPDVAKR